MFGIGMPEMLLLLAVALIVFGPKKLPDLAKSIGRALGEFKRATSDLKDSIETQTGVSDVRDSINEVKDDIKSHVDLAGSVQDPAEPESSSETSGEEPDDPMEKVKTAFDEMNADEERYAADLKQADSPDAEYPPPQDSTKP